MSHNNTNHTHICQFILFFHFFIILNFCNSMRTSSAEHLPFRLYFYFSFNVISFSRMFHFHLGDLLLTSCPTLLCHLCSISMHRRKCVCSAACMHVYVCDCETVSSCTHDSLRSVSEWLHSACGWKAVCVKTV